MAKHLLSDTACRQVKPGLKMQKLYDSRGFFLQINPIPDGRKAWRLKFFFHGRERLMSLGPYPEVSLAEARKEEEAIRELLKQGIDPAEHRKAQLDIQKENQRNTFAVVAGDWLHEVRPAFIAAHYERIVRRLEQDIIPWLGPRPIADITPPMVNDAIERIRARGAEETARRVMGDCRRIFQYAVSLGKIPQDPTRDLAGRFLPRATEDEKHFAAIVDPVRFGDLLRACDTYRGGLIVRCALKLAPLLAVRPGELRKARWADIDLETRQWSFFVTKTRVAHIVPLAEQTLATFRELKPLTGSGDFCFPSAVSRSKPMSENAVLFAMRNMGFGPDEVTGHGLRATFRTMCRELLGFPIDYIEHQLSHEVRGPLGRAYDRTTYLPERRAMMQAWADFCDWLKAGHDPAEFKGGTNEPSSS